MGAWGFFWIWDSQDVLFKNQSMFWWLRHYTKRFTMAHTPCDRNGTNLRCDNLFSTACPPPRSQLALLSTVPPILLCANPKQEMDFRASKLMSEDPVPFIKSVCSGVPGNNCGDGDEVDTWHRLSRTSEYDLGIGQVLVIHIYLKLSISLQLIHLGWQQLCGKEVKHTDREIYARAYKRETAPPSNRTPKG